MLSLAFARHGVGPRQLPGSVLQSLPAELRSKLDERSLAIVRKRLLETSLLSKISVRFAALAIDWAILKGGPLMQQLYGDATKRGSSDIDLLVRPAQFVEAIAALISVGWSLPGNPALTGLSRLTLSQIRDVELIAPTPAKLRIELHQRPLFAEPFRDTGAALLAEVESNPFPAPRFGPLLVWYCFAHGALCYWARLKWLIDFAKALSLLDIEGQRMLLAISAQRRTSHSLAASILVATVYFPGWIPPLLQHWSTERAHQSGVATRVRHYRGSLLTDDPQANSPLGNAWLNLVANFFLFEALPDRLRIAIHAPLTSMLRRLAGLGHGQAGRNKRQASP